MQEKKTYVELVQEMIRSGQKPDIDRWEDVYSVLGVSMMQGRRLKARKKLDTAPIAYLRTGGIRSFKRLLIAWNIEGRIVRKARRKKRKKKHRVTILAKVDAGE